MRPNRTPERPINCLLSLPTANGEPTTKLTPLLAVPGPGDAARVMGKKQIQERIQTVIRTDGTREQWRIMVDPGTGTEIDAFPITCCTDCQEELRSSSSGRCLSCHEARLLPPEHWGSDGTPWEADDPTVSPGINPRGG